MKLQKENYFLFSGGEVHYKLPERIDIHRIVCMDYSMNGFMALAEYKEIMDRKGLYTNLIYPYLPYARQDRIMHKNESFSLKVFCRLLNSLNFQSVTIWDPHSDVAPALINNCHVVTQEHLAKQAIPAKYFEDPNILFVSPDAGAYKKISKLAPFDDKIVIGVKHRDNEGNIVMTDVLSHISIKGKECLIVDDICDGGKTFIELAKTLKAYGALSVFLYVTHGIFSKGISPLKACIDHIYTTNSMPNENIDGTLTVTKII